MSAPGPYLEAYTRATIPPWRTLPLRGLTPESWPPRPWADPCCRCGHGLVDHTPEPRTACQAAGCPCAAFDLVAPPARKRLDACYAALDAPQRGRGAPRASAEAWTKVNTHHAHLMPSWPPEDAESLPRAVLGWIAVMAVCVLVGVGLYVAFG